MISQYGMNIEFRKANHTGFAIALKFRKDAKPQSKLDKLVRFHEPPPFWGPKSKPKRLGSNSNQVNKKVFQKNLNLPFYQT
jgi:hypothetical protein